MARTPPNALLERLAQAGVPFELIRHRRTDTAVAEADALALEPREVSKTLVLTTREGFVRAVLPASERLDLSKVRRVLGTKRAHLITEETLATEYPEFELGAVPPIAGAHRDRVLVDRRVCRRENVIFEAGTHEESLRLRTADLLRIAQAEPADLCRD